MNVPRLTLDTNLLLEYWKNQAKRKAVEKLSLLAKEGKVDLVVTARIREDVPLSPLAQKIDELPELGINETGSVTRLGYWVLGRDMLGDEAFNDFWSTAQALAEQRGKKPPDWRDWDHLHAHYLLHQDIFLTWDEGIICLSDDLRTQFGLVVMRPEAFLHLASNSNKT